MQYEKVVWIFVIVLSRCEFDWRANAVVMQSCVIAKLL